MKPVRRRQLARHSSGVVLPVLLTSFFGVVSIVVGVLLWVGTSLNPGTLPADQRFWILLTILVGVFLILLASILIFTRK